MFRLSKILSSIAFSAVLLGVATPALWSQDSSGSVVIVFKDGHRQSFRLADVARIEFEHTGPSASAGKSRFTGRWKVGVGGGQRGFFDIILTADGKAHKNIGGGGDGTWLIVNGQAVISWDDGWHDVIRKQGAKFEKAAYDPGKSLDEPSDNVASAEYLEPQ